MKLRKNKPSQQHSVKFETTGAQFSSVVMFMEGRVLNRKINLPAGNKSSVEGHSVLFIVTVIVT